MIKNSSVRTWGRLALAAAALLLATTAEAQRYHPPSRTVAQLDSPNPCSGAPQPHLVYVTDGASSTDCVTGGGSTHVLCACTNGTWGAAVAAAGGSGDITDVGDCAGPACFAAASPDAALTFDNATSGTVTLQTVAGALGTVTVSLPAETGTICTDAAVCAGYEPSGTYSGVGACPANQAAVTLNDGAGPTCSEFSALGQSIGVAEIDDGGAAATFALFSGAAGDPSFRAIVEADVSDLAHTPDTTCLDAGVDCLFAASVSEGGAATTATALAANGANCAGGEWAAGVDASGAAEGCTPDDTGTDDQTATEVPYTPTTGTDWVDPDPTEAGGALDDLAGRLTVEEAKADDDVPEAGDFGALALTGPVTSVGLATAIAADAVGTAALDDGADTPAARDVLHVDPADTEQLIYLAAPAGGTDGCAGAADKVIFNSTTGAWGCGADAGAGGGMTSWLLDADSGGPLTLTDGETALIAGGLGIVTAASAGSPETVTVSPDYAQTLAGDPTLGAEECVFTADGTGSGGLLCEGTAANTNEQLYLLPAGDGADTTNFLALGASDGDALAGDSATGFFDAGTVEVARLPAATTTASGIVELATDGEGASGVVVQGDDARLSDTRTPTDGTVTAAKMADADHGAVSWTSGVATVEDLSCTDCVADSEVVDTITASNYLPLAGGTLTGEVTADDLGLEFTPGDTLTDCSTFAATGGGIFYDDSEGKFKKCEDNSLSDLDTTGGTPSFATLTGGTNTAAAMVVGTGASLAPMGSGTITATDGDSATAFFSVGTLEDARVDGSLEADELILAGDVDGAANANDLDELAVEAELEAVLDLADLQGAVTDGQVPDNITIDLAAVATLANSVAADSVALTTGTTGNYMSDITAGTGIAITHTPAEGSSGTVAFNYTATLAADPALAAGNCIPATTGLICEGATADTIETLLTFTNPTATDKTITFPNASGTVAVSATAPITLSAAGAIGSTAATASVAGHVTTAAQTFAGAKTFNGGITCTTCIDLTAEVSATLPVGNGGTGATSLTDGGLLLGSGTGAITALGVAANGEIPIGDGTTDPVLATLTGTANEITVTNAAGSITLDIPTSPTLDGTNFSGIPSSAITTELRSMYWPAGSLSSDGTQCADPTEATINSGPKTWTILCTDNDASTVYGQAVMPDGWDGGTVTFELGYIQTAADTSALNSDITAQCHGAGETVDSTWGTEIAIDDAAVTGSNAIDLTTSAAVTPAGTCAAGDILFWRWQLDATGTTTAVATLHIVGAKMEYTSTVGD